jgi:hypothetical protein
MVPRQRFNELKPKSGRRAWNSLEFTKKKIFREIARVARGNCVGKSATLRIRRRHEVCIPSLRAKRSNPFLGIGIDGLLRRKCSSQ